MQGTFAELTTQARIGYAFLFGALFGYTAFGSTFPNGLLYVWIILAFTGIIMLFIRNTGIKNAALKMKITCTDLFVTLFLLLLINILPASLGLIKATIILALEGVYIFLFMSYFNRQLVNIH